MVSDMMRHDDNRRMVKQKENNFEERLPLCKRNSLCLDLLHETVVIYMEDGGMEGWVVEKGRGGVGFDFNDEVREIVCRTVKLDQTRKKQD